MNEPASTPAHQTAKYTIDDREMAQGSTFGSPRAMLVIKATGAIEKMFAPELGTDVFGTVVFHHWDGRTGVPLTARRGTFEVYAEHQKHLFQLSNGVDVEETILLLSTRPEGEDMRNVDPPCAYYNVELRNLSGADVEVGTYASIRLRGGLTGETDAQWDARANAFIVKGGQNPHIVRIAAATPAPQSVEATHDAAKANASSFPGKLSNASLRTHAEPIGIFHFQQVLRPGAHVAYCIKLTFSEDGEHDARRTVRALPDVQTALEQTQEYFQQVLGNAIVLTPDDEVNRGVLWAKANILRVQNLTQQGWCFVNDPTRSNNSVARDTAWYCAGGDYLAAHFTRDALLWYIEHLEPRGMVVEYFDIRDGKTEDYGLNINDDTPLIIIALWHHYCVTGDGEFLQRVWANVLRAARYILSQRNEQGLVWCSADGTADWGIVGWRNVIKGYRLSGATTEVNSECYAAFRAVSSIAHELGDAENEIAYRAHAQALKAAIDEHLLDTERNLYYLNVALDGTKRTDVTCDLVFPVLFGVADHEVASTIISRLSSQEFWSDAGMHTVPRTDINYSPTDGYGLFGGIWSGPTFWFAYAASAFNQEFMAFALSASFRHYTTDPRRNNTVPGQFCEWLHGETLTNQGMMLSPWFAPKYFWAALEGAAGLNVTGLKPRVDPHMPSAWSWIAARNVTVRGKPATWLAVRTDRLSVYSTFAFEGIEHDALYEDDITEDVALGGDTAVCVAFRRKNGIVVFAGNTLDRTITVGITLKNAHGNYKARRYNTLRSEWVENAQFDERALRHGVPVEITRHGFALLELHNAE